ncbi:hypothetical protein AQUCO_01100041v1 [Aquilegia coerulea]|uniref:Protein FAR1-RELATED SEQUENCE n=1 Tax=Aquilegia coerulea TaxID=218851 RepID=A0A2G5E5C2_AQUCA|nr:hypothetical protein AQUCO_01100041v1 [Aquilegia coerulea]
MSSYNVDEFVEEFSDDSEAQSEIPRRRNVDLLCQVGVRLQQEIHEDMGQFSDADILNARFDTDEEAYLFYNEYAKFKGFSVRKDHKTIIKGKTCKRRFICSCAGQRADKWSNLQRRRKKARRLTKCECPALLNIVYSEEFNTWIMLDFKIHLPKSVFHKDFVDVMFCKGPPENFEKKWGELLTKFKNVAKKKWVYNIYLKKEMWAEGYLREYFFAGCRSNQWCESINSVVRLWIKAGLTLIELYIRHRDFEAKVNTMMTRSAQIPNLSRIRERAEALYTRAGYEYLYKQLLHEPSYVVNETYEDGVNIKYLLNRHMYPNSPQTVEYMRDTDAYKCSCKLFERVDFICRHILAVLKHTHVSQIPKSCILHRWTRDVKSSSIIDVRTNSSSCMVGSGLRLNDLEDCARELFMWACESVQCCSRVKSHIASFDKRESEEVAQGLNQTRILDNPMGVEETRESTSAHVGLPPDKVTDPPLYRGKWDEQDSPRGRITYLTLFNLAAYPVDNMTETGETTGVDADVAEELTVSRTFPCSLCKTVGHRKNVASCPMRHQSKNSPPPIVGTRCGVQLCAMGKPCP